MFSAAYHCVLRNIIFEYRFWIKFEPVWYRVGVMNHLDNLFTTSFCVYFWKSMFTCFFCCCLVCFQLLWNITSSLLGSGEIVSFPFLCLSFSFIMLCFFVRGGSRSEVLYGRGNGAFFYRKSKKKQMCVCGWSNFLKKWKIKKEANNNTYK